MRNEKGGLISLRNASFFERNFNKCQTASWIELVIKFEGKIRLL